MNKELFIVINSLAGKNKFLDLTFIFLAKGSPYIFIIYEIYIYFIKKLKHEALFAFYSAILGLLINKIIGFFYFHNRPFMDHLGTLLIYHAPENSFPSDHTTFMFSIAFCLYFFKAPCSLILIFLAFLGGLARVYVGVHYPFDILGGIVVGFITAYVIYKFQNKLLKLNDYLLRLENKIFGKLLK